MEELGVVYEIRMSMMRGSKQIYASKCHILIKRSSRNLPELFCLLFQGHIIPMLYSISRDNTQNYSRKKTSQFFSSLLTETSHEDVYLRCRVGMLLKGPCCFHLAQSAIHHSPFEPRLPFIFSRASAPEEEALHMKTAFCPSECLF